MSAHSYILGISAFYHDSAAAILKDGVVIAAAQEERFSRKKHDHRFPELAIAYCLSEAGIEVSDLSEVAFYDKPWIKFERLLETYLSFAPSGLRSFAKAMPLWLKQKLWMGEEIKKRLGFDGDIIYPSHHESHAASAFYPSPFEEAAVLTIDGVGEWGTASWGVAKGNTLTLEAELRFPHSLGLLYSAFTYYTGFKVNSGEYKVMGLAPYGEPRFAQKIYDHLIDVKEDGSFRLDMKYFNYCQGLTMTSPAFHQLFGAEPRKPESEITQREMDLAASVQLVTEEVVLKLARHIGKTTGQKNLCLAGGVALNCVANGKILKERIFDSIWIQPAAGDAGGALGAAYFAEHVALGRDREARTNSSRDTQSGSYLGSCYSTEKIASWLDSEGIPYGRLEDQELSEASAAILAEGMVLGWFQGRMEFGPRALGGRSILGDPRNSEMQSRMNLKIKFRESFRPFAPSCLAERAGEYFELEEGDSSPYMLLTANVREEKRLADSEGELFGIEKLQHPRSTIPAVTHVDYSARVQTVDGVANPRYRELLLAFEKKTSCPILINTSFNVRGEPIVESPFDAFCCFCSTGMDALALENCLIMKADLSEELLEAFSGEAYELD